MGLGHLGDMVHDPELGPHSSPSKMQWQPERPNVLALGSVPVSPKQLCLRCPS